MLEIWQKSLLKIVDFYVLCRELRISIIYALNVMYSDPYVYRNMSKIITLLEIWQKLARKKVDINVCYGALRNYPYVYRNMSKIITLLEIWQKLAHKKVDINVCYVCTLSKNLKLTPLAPALRAGARFARIKYTSMTQSVKQWIYLQTCLSAIFNQLFKAHFF